MIPTTHDPALMFKMRNRRCMARTYTQDDVQLERVVSVFPATDHEDGVIRWLLSIMEVSDDRFADAEFWARYHYRDWRLALEDGAALAEHYGFRLRVATPGHGWQWQCPLDVAELAALVNPMEA